MSPQVAVLGAGAFLEGFAGLDAWLRGAPDPEQTRPAASIVPARQRRRASTLSKALAEAYAEAVYAAKVDVSTVASVFGSALGEATTMIGLLDQMWDDDAMLSPMKFATSVHNAASGLVSIATTNRGFTTSLGADYDTPAMALFEGTARALSENEPVVVCCGDEAPPEDLVPEGAGWKLLTAAIVLAPVEAGTSLPRLSAPSIATADIVTRDVPAAIGQNPSVGLLDLVWAISSRESGTLALDRGAGRGYTVSIDCDPR